VQLNKATTAGGAISSCETSSRWKKYTNKIIYYIPFIAQDWLTAQIGYSTDTTSICNVLVFDIAFTRVNT